MTLKIQDAGTLRTITRGYVKQAGILRTLREIKVMDGGTLRTVAVFATPLSASASPSSVSGTQGSSGAISINTSSTTASPSGGLAPYTYSWALVSGVGTANSPTSATTNFNATITPGTQVSTFRVTVTDAAGQTATADVTATFTNAGGGGIDP